MAGAPQTIYVDFDDCLCATARGFIDVLEAEFGKRVAFEAITDFDLGRSFDLDQDELARFFEVAHEDEVLAGFEPLEGALEAISEWKAAGYRVDVVTGRPPGTREVSTAWLETHQVAFDQLVFVDKYGHAPGGRPLAEIVECDYAWVVEDSWAMAAELARGGHAVHLLDRPWNRDRPRRRPWRPIETGEAENTPAGTIQRWTDWFQVRDAVSS